MGDEAQKTGARGPNEQSTFGDALDLRIGHRALWRRAADEPVVGGARVVYAFGSALTVMIALQAITGLLLMTAYAPSAQSAWASVHAITFRMTAGWVIRGLHHWGSSATVVLMAAHLAQTAIFGAYKSPREVNWWLGLVLMGIVLGFALTGYLLPWDQKGYWATRVATNILGTVPLVGHAAQRIVQGGEGYGTLTLTRFYSLHVGLLPFALLATLTAHVALFRKHGVTPGFVHDASRVDRFFPKQAAIDVAVALVVTALLFGLVFKMHGAPLDAPADPSSNYPARPEWYFLPLFQALKYFHGPFEVVGTLLLPSVVVLFLFALPLVDRARTTAVAARLPWLLVLAFGIAAATALIVLSLRADARDPKFAEARAVADERAPAANAIAMGGVPPEGPLVMLERDPGLRGAELWARRCVSCHSIGAKHVSKAKADGSTTLAAPDLETWGGAQWLESMIRTPDAPSRFGRSSLKGQMPSLTNPVKPELGPGMKDEDVKRVVAFVVSQDLHDEKGRDVFENACGDCHRMAGTSAGGFDNEYAPDLTGWGTYEWMRAQIGNPASGKTYKAATSTTDVEGHMPAFGGSSDAASSAKVEGSEKGSEEGSDLDVIARWVFAEATGRAPPAAVARVLETPPNQGSR